MNATSWLEGLPAPERWRALLLGEGPRVATAILIVALCAQAAFIVTDLAGGGRGAKPAAQAAVRAHPLDLTAIVNAHLAGVAPQATPDGQDVRPSNIPLVLTGTIAGNDPQNGLAILGQTPQTAKVYAVVDYVPGWAKLHSVYSDRVVIDRNGQLESVALPRQINAGNAPPPSAAVLQGDNPQIERMRRMITEQPGLLADVMSPQPVMDHGRMNGFRVYPGRNRMAFMRLGLRPGDQVTAINGTPLDDRDRGEQILHTLGTSSEAHITVIRNGQPQDLVLNIAQVAQEADSLAGQGQAVQGGAAAPGVEPAPPPPPAEPDGNPAGQ